MSPEEPFEISGQGWRRLTAVSHAPSKERT